MKDAGIDVKVEHINDVCECKEPLGQYSAYVTTLLGRMGSRPFFTKSEVKKYAKMEKLLAKLKKERDSK